MSSILKYNVTLFKKKKKKNNFKYENVYDFSPPIILQIPRLLLGTHISAMLSFTTLLVEVPDNVTESVCPYEFMPLVIILEVLSFLDVCCGVPTIVNTLLYITRHCIPVAGVVLVGVSLEMMEVILVVVMNNNKTNKI